MSLRKLVEDHIRELVYTIHNILELGARDLKDAISYANDFPNVQNIYAFEPNPNQKEICEKNLFLELAIKK